MHLVEGIEKLSPNLRLQLLADGEVPHQRKVWVETPDGDGSLLDNTILLYGSGISNSMHFRRKAHRHPAEKPVGPAARP